jgi:hypothetical protein
MKNADIALNTASHASTSLRGYGGRTATASSMDARRDAKRRANRAGRRANKAILGATVRGEF